MVHLRVVGDFRREDGDVFDANKSFYAHHEAGNTSVPFNDVLGGGAQWSVGSMTGSWLPDSFAALLDSFVASSGTEDAYSFTISKLNVNEPYTLYLYSANGNSSGNAVFTIGGVSKGAEGLWLLGATPMLTRFDAVSDANGVISGTFAVADGNGGAFNGLTLVGGLPKYKSPAFTLIIR